MGKTIPDWLQTPWDILCYLAGGAPWPEGDEDALKRLAAGHRAEQRAAETYKQNLERELASLRGAISGEAGSAIFDRLGKLIDAAGKHAEHHGKLAESVDRFADATEETKEGIIEGLIALAAQLAVELALSYFSAGISDLAALASAAATRSVIVGLVRSLIERAAEGAVGRLALNIAKIGAREALIGSAVGAGADALTQGGFMLAGSRDHFDMGKVGNSAEAGAVGGAVGGVAGRGAANLAGRALGDLAGSTGGRIAQGLTAGGVGGLAGGAAGAVDQGGLEALKHPDQVLNGAALGAVMGGAAGVRSHTPVEGRNGAGHGLAPEEPGIANLADEPHGGGKGDGHTPAGIADGGNFKKPPTTETNGHIDGNGPGHEQPRQHEAQDQQTIQPVPEARQASPEARPSADQQQRAALASDQARGATPNPDRPLAARDQPAPSAGGDRPAAPGTRLSEQPAASLSNAADRPHAGAAATMRDTSVSKAVEPVVAKHAEPVRATAGLPEARPIEPRPAEQRVSVEPRHAEAEQPRTHPAERASTAEAPTRHDQVAPQDAAASTATHLNGEAPSSAEPHAEPTAAHLADHPLHENHETKPAIELPNGTPHPTDPPHRQPPSGDGPRSGDHRAAWMRGALESGDLPRRPGRLKQLWDHLTAAEKDQLYLKDPMIGCRDGLPMTDRDHYNQHELTRQLEHNPNDKRLQHLAQTLESEPFPGRARSSERLLVTFDPEGHSAIALGNPDKASHTAVFVPGTGAAEHSYLPGNPDKPGAQGYLERAERMVDEADDNLTGENDEASVVVWIDYDTPTFKPWDNFTGRRGAAEHAAPRLRSFCEGLRATHEGERPGQTTVIGHSYGTRAVGEAAKASGGGLDADRVINLASPGMGVKTVNELALRGTLPEEMGKRVYSTIDPHDFLTMIEKAHAERIAHGTLPTDEAGFGGGVVFDSEPHRGPWWLGWVKPSAHMLYWEHDTAALVNTGRIIAGRQPYLLGQTPRTGEHQL